MKKRFLIIIIILFIIIVLGFSGFSLYMLNSNKTFFSTTYIGVDGQEIFIPKYSYFKNECCMTVATFTSFKSKKELKKEIDNYMKDFEYFEDESTYGYRKDGLFIQNYEVTDIGLYRKIIIVY